MNRLAERGNSSPACEHDQALGTASLASGVMMSLANWTTRFLVGSAQGSEMQPDGQSSGSGSDDSAGASAQRAGPRSLVGSRVGAYLITKRLGAGGVGEVFKGVDVMLKREVAIKVLRHELASDPLFLERFRHEAQIHAQLSHPNVASVHAFLHEGDTQFMVMEYVPGISLDEFVRSGGPVPAERALRIFRHALDGIEHAHRCGIVHRDIKPANIMLADSGPVKVMDFGIARALDCQEHLTRHGQVAGTAKSMSPEQIRGAQADVRSDIYSLGIVLYTLLAGRAPFEGRSDHALMKAQLEQAPPPLHALVDNVPPKVEAAVMRALEKDPSARFQTVGAFSRALDACLAELATASPPTPDQRDAQTSSRTVVNPALADAQRLPKGGARRAAQGPGRLRHFAASVRTAAGRLRPAAALRTLPRLGAVAVALALPALLAGTVMEWPRLAQREAPAAVSPGPVAVSPTLQQVSPPPPVERVAAAQIPPVSVPEPAPAAASKPPGGTVPPRTLAIVRLPLDDTASAGSDATHRFKPGERISLLVTPSQDAHVYCYLQDEARRIVRFYPNRFSKSALVRTAKPLKIPGRMRFEIVANTRNVTETVACFASEKDVMSELPAAVVGTDFARLPATTLDQVRSAFAAIAADTLSEASFRVQFK
ncbi:MAG TPA: serine/threonine-protein kinase [Albitalea sp.]